MKLQRFKKLFLRTKKMNATTARQSMPRTYEDEDDGSTRLSGAFIVVLLLHVVAVVGVIAFTRIKENRKASTPALVTNGSETSPSDSGTATAASTAAVALEHKATSAKSTPTAEENARASFLVASKVDARPVDAKRTEAATTPRNTATAYVVKAGDNPAKIARELGVPYEDLVKLNNIKDPRKLQPGQKLKVPPKKG